jgi:hypothetical protein
MNLDDYLEQITLIDCSGQITHRLTLQIDGTVKVQAGQVEVTVDPSTRQLRPAARQLGRGEYGHDQVIDLACSLARGG